ncbi:MAG TPA: DUF1523 domain-containing protein [Clostridium sp.]|jgi:hypothetical protein|uniref:DUF1523 family protein n=1 Tax=Clostridium lapidicellarium TaxID=3240931 RepID=A0ABV4DZI9_9CLOT|nr:DUF1523 family protein [uncultured Clostridium sp.]NLU09062.1 DUF1523 family protein [Clostridiales bacterium]HBC96207.1 DUF1523 domain-containing protein [Clostridium sp.]
MRKKYFYNSRHHRSFLKLKIRTVIIIIAVILAAAGTFKLIPHFFRSTYIVTIANKHTKVENSNNTYMIYTQLENGETKVFKNTNSFLELKFNSEDIYGGLRVNKKYKITAYGFRIPIFSCYENIVKAKAFSNSK